MILFDKIPKKDLISNDKFRELDGYLDEELAKATLAEFLHNNLGFTCQLLLGYELFPYQEIILRGWFDHNFNFMVAARGGSKSTLAAIFCILYPIFNPNTKIVLASNTFRSTRRILKQVESFLNNKKAILAKQCFTDNPKGKLEFAKRADEMVIEINGGSIVALPLNDKIRGTRADVIICDEFLQIPEDLYKSVLVPFLAAKSDIQAQMALDKEEDAMVEAGIITDDQRTTSDSKKKILALSSASYDFDFCYRLYREWINNIEKPKSKKDKRSYFVCRLSYLALPDQLVEKDIAEEIKAGGEGTAAFEREWMAKFSSSSDGFFNIQKLHECTVKPGHLPCVQLKGTKGSSYIIAVDPSFSSSKSSDFFAICVYLLNSDSRTITLVHSYGKPGTDLKEHIAYFHYVVMAFNPVFIIADLGGNNVNFIETCNESQLFSSNNINLKFIDGDFGGEQYLEECKKAKASYNQLDRRICYRQRFFSSWLREANEWLQTQISGGKVWFASNLEANDEMFRKTIEGDVPFIIKHELSTNPSAFIDYIAMQDEFIDQTKRQVALIDPKINSSGVMQFDLPTHIKNSKKPERARKDNYTCLLLACWGAKCFWDIMYRVEEEKEQEMFIPRFIL
jgi:hypothetical protein